MELFEVLRYTAIGFSIVFLALIVITLAIMLFLKLDASWEEREARQSVERDIKPQTIDDTTLVLISAAVATLIKQRVQIKRIRRLPRLARHGGAWADSGRIYLLGSHNITKRD